MLKKNKLPREVLEELEVNPNISENMVEAARRATIHDEGWERISRNNTNIVFPEVIETGLTVGDLVK